MKIRTGFIILISFFYCRGNAQSKSITIIDYQGLEKIVHQPHDTLYIINFWATWCKPCIEEMPHFELVASSYKNKPVKLLFISLDFKSKAESVATFVKEKKIKQQVYLLSAGNPNDWVDKIDVSWSGAIPATAFYKKGKKVDFREGELSEQELTVIIKKQL